MVEEWSAGGRFLAKDYLDLDYFPCVLITAFIVCVIFEKIFLQSFQSCITKDEEDAVDKLLKENFDADELIDVLNRFDCRKVVTKKSLRAYSRSDS